MLLHPSTQIKDSSKIQDFLDCPRKYFYRHVLGWQKDEPDHALHFGTCVHSAFDALYSYGFNPTALELAKVTFLDQYREQFGEDTDDIYFPKSPAMVNELLDYYYQKEEKNKDRYETLFTEIAGSVPILHDHRLHFRCDRLCKDTQTGLYQVREYKTTGRNDRQWRDQWLLSTQIGTYTHVLYSLYEQGEVDGVLVEGLLFQKKGIDILQLPCRRTAEQMLSWLYSTTYWCDAINANLFVLTEKCTDSDDVMASFPLNSQSCTKYFGCEYHAYCTAWSNPLQHCEEPPIGFKVEYWNPMDKPAKKEFTL